MDTLKSPGEDSATVHGTDLLDAKYTFEVCMIGHSKSAIQICIQADNEVEGRARLVLTEDQLDELLTVLEDYWGRLVQARLDQERNDN